MTDWMLDWHGYPAAYLLHGPRGVTIAPSCPCCVDRSPLVVDAAQVTIMPPITEDEIVTFAAELDAADRALPGALPLTRDDERTLAWHRARIADEARRETSRMRAFLRYLWFGPR